MARGQRRDTPPVRKGLGQHFLQDRRILTRIVDVLAPTADETVVEVGPGRGSLTDVLRDRAARVVAIEYDRLLAELLRKRYEGDERVRIVQADVLTVDLGAVAGGAYAVVGNVPYYITTPILFHAMKPPRATRAVFLVQREVAERMSAAPGGKEYGALSVNLQVLADVRVEFRIPAGAFQPPPKVESAVVRVTPRTTPLVAAADEEPFREMVQGIFGMRRKQMRRVIRELYGMTAAHADDVLRAATIDPEARPETLRVEDFVQLQRTLPRDAA